MGLDAEREQLKRVYGKIFGQNANRIIDKLSDGQIVRLYMRLKLQGKLDRRN